MRLRQAARGENPYQRLEQIKNNSSSDIMSIIFSSIGIVVVFFIIGAIVSLFGHAKVGDYIFYAGIGLAVIVAIWSIYDSVK